MSINDARSPEKLMGPGGDRSREVRVSSIRRKCCTQASFQCGYLDRTQKFGKLGIEIELKMTRIRKASAKKEARNVKNRDKIVK